MSLFKANFSSEIKTLPSAGKKISGVLPAGQTEITLTDDTIKSDSKLDVVYTSIYGASVRSANFEAGSITLVFSVQSEDMTVMAVFDSTIANGKDGEDGKDGKDGADGKDGTDGKDGENGKDGTNGEPGTPGTDGKDGKSAYQYAQDGGYTGTEEEFIDLLVNGSPNVIKITDIVDNLTSTATNLPLSAKQGKALNDKIENSGSNKWTLILNNDTTTKVDMTNYSEIRVYVYGKAKDSVCKYSMSHDFLIDELLSQDDYFATIPGNIGYGDDFDNAFIDFYPTTSKRSFGVGYVDARYGGEYCSDATFKIYAR